MKSYFNTPNTLDNYGILKSNIKNIEYDKIRSDIFSESTRIEFTIFLSGIIAYSSSKEIIRKGKEELIRLCFSNLLERICFFANEKSKNNNSESLELISDWPDANNNKPYIDVYRNEFYEGKDYRGVNSQSGNLLDNAFRPALLFSDTCSNPLLQFTDLIIGALVDCIKMIYNNSTSLTSYTNILISKLYGYPDKIIDRGIKISTCDNSFMDRMKKSFIEDIPF